MRGQESEAYEIDALARQRLKDIGLHETGKLDEGVVFSLGAGSDARVILTHGSREGSVLNYGECILQEKNGNGWGCMQKMSKHDFAYGREHLNFPRRSLPVLGLRPPGP